MKKIVITKKMEKRLEMPLTIIVIVTAITVFAFPVLALPFAIWNNTIAMLIAFSFCFGLIMSIILAIIQIILAYFCTTNPLLKRKEPLKFEYNEDYLFEETLIKELLNEKYILYDNTIIDNIEIDIYLKETKNIKKIVTKVKVQKFDENMINIIDKYMSKTFRKNKRKNIYFIPIIITEEETNYLKEWLKSLDYQDDYKCKLFVGFIKNKKELYISNQNTRLGIGKYNKIKKEFLSIIKINI